MLLLTLEMIALDRKKQQICIDTKCTKISLNMELRINELLTIKYKDVLKSFQPDQEDISSLQKTFTHS